LGLGVSIAILVGHSALAGQRGWPLSEELTLASIDGFAALDPQTGRSLVEVCGPAEETVALEEPYWTLSVQSLPEIGPNPFQRASQVLPLGAHGAVGDQRLQNLVIGDTQIFEAFNSITAGPNFSIVPPGDVTLVAPLVEFQSGVSVDGEMEIVNGVFIAVDKTAAPVSMLEPGGPVTFTVRVSNSSVSPDSVTLDALVDDIHGNLNGQGTCAVSQVIAPGDFYECDFTVAVNGAAGTTETDTVTATATVAGGNSINVQDSATVTIHGPVDRVTLVSGSNQIALPLTSLTDPLVVSAVDSLDIPVPGVGVSFSVTSGGGNLASVDAVTDANGEARANWTLGPLWGTHTVEVTAVGASTPVVFQATTSTIGVSMEQIGQAIDLDPPQGSTAPSISGTGSSLREFAILSMHEVHLQSLPAMGPAVEAFYVDRMNHMIAEYAQPVTSGVRIWMMYNHGFVVKSPTRTIAFDLRDNPPSWGPSWAYQLPAALVDQIDILFISHEHEDHWQDRIALAVLANGGDVVYPAAALALDAYGNVPLADLGTTTLSGLDIYGYHGFHNVVSMIYEVTTPEGIRVMHTGDNDHSGWIPLAGGNPVDVMLINGWINEHGNESATTGMINAVSRAEPWMMIPGHYARFAGNTAAERSMWSFPAAMDVPPGLPPGNESDVQPLLWGERIDYMPGMPLTLSVTTTWLPEGETTVPYSATLTARGGDGVYTWSLVEGFLPTDLSLAANGEFSGTPTVLETQNFIVEATSGDGQTDRQELSITVVEPLPVLQPHELCSDYVDAIATFEDGALETEVRTALGIGPLDNLTCSLLSGLTVLKAENRGITSVLGMQNIPNLTQGWLSRNSISDLSPLSGLTGMIWLFLDRNQITDLGPLGGLTSMTRLDLEYNSITDLSPLNTCTSLTWLYVWGNSISDLTGIGGMPSLRYFLVDDNQITDVSPLAAFPNLAFLQLKDNQITDISGLSGLTSLRLLHLSNNQITNIGALSGMTQMSSQLYLDNNQITDISPLSGPRPTPVIALNDNLITDVSALSEYTNLGAVRLQNNVNLSNIQPLIDNPSLGVVNCGNCGPDSVDLSNTNVSCADVALLEAKGVTVIHTCQ
jgi:L-ascorbate metabolism protein UlaG (beta-lactamase superfamily)